jgi:predicted small metal-binding protein
MRDMKERSISTTSRRARSDRRGDLVLVFTGSLVVPRRAAMAARAAREESVMSKEFRCADVGQSCSFVAKGEKVEDVLAQVGKHAAEVHKMQVTPELVATVKQKVREV